MKITKAKEDCCEIDSLEEFLKDNEGTENPIDPSMIISVKIKHLKERPSKLKKLKTPERDLRLKRPEREMNLTTR